MIDVVVEKVNVTDKNYTYADYLKFTFDEMVEVLKGKIFKTSPSPASAHQLVSNN